MRDSNIDILLTKNLPSVEEVIGELESQPTPDVTSEIMQEVRTIQKITTTAKNLKGTYVHSLRMAALKIHAEINLLAHRNMEEHNGNGEKVVGLRRKRASGWIVKD